MQPRQTFESLFDPRRNSLNALRLVLAVLVIVSHSWPIGGYGDDPGVHEGNDLGAWAVAGFFAISGYLITASRLHSRSFGDYLWRRFLRIYPGFLAVLLVIAFGFATISSLLDPTAEWSIGSAFRFLLPNLGLYVAHTDVAGTLDAVPYRNVWDGSLWTLGYEFLCYLIIGALVSLIRTERALAWACGAWFVAATVATLGVHLVGIEGDPAPARFLRLSTYFAAGALIYLKRNQLPARGWLAAVAGVLLVGLVLSDQFGAFAAAPAAYLVLWLGARLPLHRVASRNDVSYGMYVYAFPVQQLLVLASAGVILPPWLFAVLATALTVPFAWASWLLVERPAMRLKRLTAGRHLDREGRVLST